MIKILRKGYWRQIWKVLGATIMGLLMIMA